LSGNVRERRRALGTRPLHSAECGPHHAAGRPRPARSREPPSACHSDPRQRPANASNRAPACGIS